MELAVVGATVHGTYVRLFYQKSIYLSISIYGTPEAGTRTPYVQCVGPRGQLPCASGTYSTQEAGWYAYTVVL